MNLQVREFQLNCQVKIEGLELDVVRVCFIGAGAHANAVHYPSLASMEDVEIVAICDLIEERLRRTAKKYGVKNTFKDYKEMLSKVKADAIYVIMPPHHLYDIVAYCLRRGLNVFIEKPPGVTPYQTKSMALLAKHHGCRTMVGFNRRFIPLVRKVRELIEKRGPIIQAVATFYKHYFGDIIPYYDGAVDILTCDAIHAVDMLRWMCGEPIDVVSLVNKFYTNYENSFIALMKFDSGAVGVLLTNWAAGSRIHTFEMHSRGISAFINPDDKAVIYMDNKEEPITISTTEAANSEDRVYYYGFYSENRHFIDCIKYDREPETNFEDAAKTMELVYLIYKKRI